MALHARHVRRSLGQGFYQGWDLHPAQLIARYAAVYAFFDQSAAEAGRVTVALWRDGVWAAVRSQAVAVADAAAAAAVSVMPSCRRVMNKPSEASVFR